MSSERKSYSVAEVNRKARMVLESGVGELWVEGTERFYRGMNNG